MKKIFLWLIPFLFSGFLLQAQNKAPLLSNKELKFSFNEEGTHYVKMTVAAQIWMRYTETNPGTTVFDTEKSEIFDVGIRRTRIQLYSQLTDRVFIYTQFGINNFNYLSQRKTGAFFHDITAEYAFIPKHLTIGAGLSGWSGPARFSSPSIGTIMMYDAPLFEQTTNDVNDQFLRKLGIFFKGKIGKLDYRATITQPFVMQTSVNYTPVISQNITSFSNRPPELQFQGYFMYQFFDQEGNLTPYTTGTYLGNKKIFNLGVGFVHQPNAMWSLKGADTLQSAMTLFAVDAYYDAPLNAEKKNAITAYAAYFNNDFGSNYVRNLGVMNPANGVLAGKGTFNGAGNAYPMEGTGSTLYAQFGYLFKKDLLKEFGTLQLFADCTYSNFQRIKDPLVTYNLGFNWLVNGHNAKWSFNYQNRPIITTDVNNELKSTDRKGMFVLQYQIFF